MPLEDRVSGVDVGTDGIVGSKSRYKNEKKDRRVGIEIKKRIQE